MSLKEFREGTVYIEATGGLFNTVYRVKGAEIQYRHNYRGEWNRCIEQDPQVFFTEDQIRYNYMAFISPEEYVTECLGRYSTL